MHVTLLDVDRMAKYLDIPPRDALETYVLEDPDAGGFLMLGKDEDGWCRLNTADKRCSIHPAKPAACVLYVCDESLKSAQGYPWPLMFDNAQGLAFIVERSIAHEVTELYVEENGATWNEAAYNEAIEDIVCRVEESKRQTMRAARLPDDSSAGSSAGLSAFITFDCTSCRLRATCCKDRPLTLVDIQIVAQRLGMTFREFFDEKVSPTLHEKAEGLLSLKRSEHGHCVFLNPETGRCSIKEVQPLHCRLMPCPAITQDADTTERYFLGAGSLEEQFCYSIAEAVTRRYVSEHGAVFNEEDVRKHLALFEQLLSDPAQFDDFCRAIAPYRYENERKIAGSNKRATGQSAER